MERHFLKRMNAQKLESSVQCSRQRQLLVEDGHQQVNGHRNPDLGLHRVGTRSVVVLDTQVAFDPAKEQFDPPAQPINLGNSQCRLKSAGKAAKALGKVGWPIWSLRKPVA